MTDSQHIAPRATFSHMEHGTREDWVVISVEFTPFTRALPDHVLAHLELFDGDCGSFPIGRFAHSLQAATLAHRDGHDEEYVVYMLLYDIDDTLGSFNYPDIAAVILKPFVSPESPWIIKRHGILRGYYLFYHLGLDRNLREQYRSQPKLFKHVAELCAECDAVAFMPDCDSLPFSSFKSVVRCVLVKPRNPICVKEGKNELSQSKATAA